MVLPTDPNRSETPRRRTRRVGGVLLAVAAAVVLVGAYAYYRAETEEIVRERHQAMSAIAELKATQVVRWCDHLKEHVSAAAANRVLVRALEPAGPAAAGGRRDVETLDDLLAFFQGHHEYDTVLLLTPGAEVLAGARTHDSAVPPATRVAARQALGSDVPVLSTFFRGSDGAVHIDALAAVRDAAGVPLAVLVFRTSASATLHPLIQNWPTPSQSGETLLVAADGDHVVFLNELRHRSNTALTFRLPRTDRSLPAVHAVEGRVGQFSGRDYRGVEVLADLRPIEGTPWFLVAKIDKSEIVAEARSRAGAISLVAVLLIGLAAAATAYLYRRHQATLYQRLYESERKAQAAAQEARHVLEESEERLRLALRAANQGLYDLDVQTGEAIVTPEYATMLGYDPTTFHETTAAWIGRLHPDDRERVQRAYRDYVAGQLAEYRVEFRQRTATGEWKWILSLGKIVSHTPDGRPLRMLGTHTDITERKAAEDRREHLEAQLKQAQKMEAIGQLAGGIAHDFNNLLTIINGRADFAIAPLAEHHPLRAELSEIREAGERAAVLVRQLLTFGRRQVVAPEVLSLSDVVSGMQNMLRRLISEDIHLAVSASEHACLVRADPGQLQQVVLNIAINAHDAMPAGGTLTIETRAVDLPAGEAEATPALPPGRYASLTMADNGSGMDEATRARIFEPFFTTKGLGKGTGLGLSTAYGIVTQGGGNIAVASAPGRGTTFRIYLPLVDAEPSLARSQAPQTAVARGTETILVVDDEPGLVTVAQRALAFAGYTVLTATGGEEALRVLAAHDGRVALVVTDVVIPGISGLELAERITREYPGTKILYSSGYTDDAVLRRGVESSRTHFIGKPYTLTDLTRKVREMLDE